MAPEKILQQVVRIAKEQLEGSGGESVGGETGPNNETLLPDTELETVGMDSTESKQVGVGVPRHLTRTKHGAHHAKHDEDRPRKDSPPASILIFNALFLLRTSWPNIADNAVVDGRDMCPERRGSREIWKKPCLHE